MIGVQHEPIDQAQLVAAVQSDQDGAVATFCGVVRDHNRGRRVTGLTYTAYEEMATQELERVCKQAEERFDVGKVAAVHRIGELAIGDVAVVVAVAAPHRGAAFDACRFVIDTLKQTVPIWKRERFEGGEEWIEGAG